MSDTQIDSIQYLNFAKKWFIQYSIQYCFTQDSIQNIIQFKINSGDSIQNIIQFNSQGMINTGRIGKVPKNWPKSVQNRQKRGLFIKKGKYRFKNWVIHSFHNKIQFKGLFNIIFSGIFNSKNYSIIFFPGKFNSKILIWLDSIQWNIHSIRKPGYRPPLLYNNNLNDDIDCWYLYFRISMGTFDIEI